MDRSNPEANRIRDELWKDVEGTRQKYEEAIHNFQVVLTELPMGNPHSAARIRQAGAIQYEASVRYLEALKKFTDFILGRTIREKDT